MSDVISRQIDKVRQLTQQAANAVVDDDISQCSTLLEQRQELLVLLEQNIQDEAVVTQAAKEDYIALLQWILQFDANAIKLLSDSKQTTLEKSSQQSKNKYALKQYQANFR